MCVLILLDRMDEERLSLLQENVAGSKDKEECLIMGMDLLQAASQSSSLVVRYLTSLQQLSGEDVQTRRTNESQRDDIAENNSSQGMSDVQNGTLPFGIDYFDPVWPNDLEVGNFDDWLAGAELWADSSTSAAAFMS